jgi:hypothetical protein
MLVLPAQAAQGSGDNSPLLVRGKLVSLDLESNEAWRARYQAQFELQLVNVSQRNIIAIRRDPMRVNGSSAYWTPQGELVFEAHETIEDQAPRSVLDHAVPPDRFTVILKPGEAYTTTLTVPLEFDRSTRAEPKDTPLFPKSGRATLELTLAQLPLMIFDDVPDEDGRLYGNDLALHLKDKWAGAGDLYTEQIDAEAIEIALPAPPPAPQESRLVLRGQVSSVRAVGETKDDVRFTADLDLEFVNSGDRPVILLRPDAVGKYTKSESEEYWVLDAALGDSLDSMRRSNYVYSACRGPSVYRNENWERLQSDLDQPQPWPLLLWVIPPGQSRAYRTTVYLVFARKPSNFDLIPIKTWTEISGLSSLWLQVKLEIWPFNVEPKVDIRNPEFGRHLRERWSSAGVLELGEDGNIISEPMQLALPKRARSTAPAK